MLPEKKLSALCVFGLFVGLLAGCSSVAVSQDRIGPPLTIESLKHWPDVVSETSGLAKFGGYLWTINDSGGKASLYAFNDQDYVFSKQVEIQGAKNIDWESLAQNQKHLFIADCGNNRGKRETLDIYKVSLKQIAKAESGDKVAAKKIRFHYADRIGSVDSKSHNYDCEALAFVGEQLWLFTKNRGDLQSRLYVLDKKQADQAVEPVMTLPVAGLITAADYNEKTHTLVLLGYQKPSMFGQSFVWVIDVVAGLPDWDRATYHTILPYGQWEGVLWDGDNALLLTSEKSRLGAQQIGRLRLPD
ncbi:hypothetical protein [Neptunomonas antarctica]|uniref:SdiA-regulated n=1 Tax=Neptunomonas antarctica TaxID=619304 RepID=A0A1N7K8K6_9GAMM|nr:hypothetical protein [Neptunomonas antarctica]SIS57919.1 hypothetical protein SAMN05421760_102260 [Neptunomonas antarctica]